MTIHEKQKNGVSIRKQSDEDHEALIAAVIFSICAQCLANCAHFKWWYQGREHWMESRFRNLARVSLILEYFKNQFFYLSMNSIFKNLKLVQFFMDSWNVTNWAGYTLKNISNTAHSLWHISHYQQYLMCFHRR